MAEQSISLEGADGVVSPAGESNADDAEVGDAIIEQADDDGNGEASNASNSSSRQQRVTPGSSAPRDEESVRYRVLNESRRSKPARSTCPLWKFFMVYTSESLSGIAVCKLCEANGDLGLAEIRYSSPTHLRQHLDTKKREGHREALKYHEEEAAAAAGAAAVSAKASDSGGSSGWVAAGGKGAGEGAGAALAFMDDVKPFTRKIVRFIIDSHQPLSVSVEAVGLGAGTRSNMHCHYVLSYRCTAAVLLAGAVSAGFHDKCDIKSVGVVSQLAGCSWQAGCRSQLVVSRDLLA